MFASNVMGAGDHSLGKGRRRGFTKSGIGN